MFQIASVLTMVNVLAFPVTGPTEHIYCDSSSRVNLVENSTGKLTKGTHDAELRNMRYKLTLEIFDEDYNWVEHEFTLTPEVAMPVRGGWLVGRDLGEFGGELAFIDDNGAARLLLEENVEDIHEMPFGYIVITGLAHLGLNDGAVYLVSVGGSGEPEISKLHDLPKAPMRSDQFTTGSVLIRTYGPSFLFGLDQSLKPAKCVDVVD